MRSVSEFADKAADSLTCSTGNNGAFEIRKRGSEQTAVASHFRGSGRIASAGYNYHRPSQFRTASRREPAHCGGVFARWEFRLTRGNQEPHHTFHVIAIGKHL